MSSLPALAPLSPAGWVQLGEALEAMLWIWDVPSGRILYANPAFGHFWGCGPQEAGSGRNALLQWVLPEDAPRLRGVRAGLPQEGYVLEYRARQPAAQGRPAREARLRERAFALRGADGAQQVVHVARDVSWEFDTTARLRAEITRRADAERSLNDANARLQALLATANDAVITIDTASAVIDWNNAAERMFGYSRSEVLGRNMAQLIIPPALRQGHLDGIARYLRSGKAVILHRRVETRAIRRTGEEFDAELSVWPVQTAAGLTFSSFVRDISRRKAAAKALAESEAKYRKVVENVNEGILVTAGGRILYANPRSLALTGLDEETALSRPFIEFIHPEDRDRVLDNHLRRLRGEEVENYYQFRVLHPGGGVRWLEISAVVFEWQGQPATLNFLTDVTERRRAEEELRNALRRERELSELKSRFVAMASHEFRTPLAAILSSIELLDDYGPRLPDEERKEIIGLVKGAVARMNGMVEQVLLTSKIESGGFAFRPAPVAVPALLSQLASELVQANPQARRVTFTCQGLEAERLLDAQLVRHILTNLLNNALKYSPADAPVTCMAVADGEHVRLSVRDRGIGIPEADQPRLFESFHRGTNVGNVPGTGIGLYVVKECVALHQGQVDVESSLGEGTTFRVTLRAPLAGAGAGAGEAT